MPDAMALGAKVARHDGPDIDPDDLDRTGGAGYRAIVRQVLHSHLHTLAEAPIDRTEVCLHTMACDEQFRAGPLNDRPDVLVAGPCSGHGFRFSGLIGRILATLGRTNLAIDPWRIVPVESRAFAEPVP
jgi:sarcosine oxidase